MLKIERVAAAALAGAIVSAAAAQDAVQWRVEDGGNGHWYASVAANTWLEADPLVRGRGAHLATISNEQENALLRDVLLATSATRGYLGLQQLDDQEAPDIGWYWDDGTALEFTNWTDFGGGLPFVAPDDTPCAIPPYWVENNQANIGMISRDGSWDDLERGQLPCDTPWNHVALLEWSADCNGDGIVDYGQILDGTFADEDGNGVPDCCEPTYCLGDLNGDDAVGPPDLGILLAVWGTDGGKIDGADLNSDGTVNAADLGLLIGAWGECGCN